MEMESEHMEDEVDLHVDGAEAMALWSGQNTADSADDNNNGVQPSNVYSERLRSLSQNEGTPGSCELMIIARNSVFQCNASNSCYTCTNMYMCIVLTNSPLNQTHHEYMCFH